MWKYYYLVRVQYLGYRFHGWAKQPKIKTVHHMIDRTFRYVFDHSDYKTLGSSRTDAMVSANETNFELFLKEAIDRDAILQLFNDNLPGDIRALSITEVDSHFNIIQAPKLKEYVYLFSHGTKNHPFSAPFIYGFKEVLNIELMNEGARLFEGEHDFKRYCTKPKENAKTIRTIDFCRIRKNDVMTASFFPDNSWAFHVHAKGFMRNQVRLMMGQLYLLGKGDLQLVDFKRSFKDVLSPYFDYIAPASALLLNKVHFEK
jgi:tRNA pseudouridine38-40 synthase